MAEFLREYMIKLGFQIDEEQWKKFQGAVGKVSKGTVELGAEAIATAFAVGKAVSSIATHVRDLQNLSARVGISATHLQAYGFAASQIGISAEDAIAGIRAMNIAMVSNPALAGFAQSLLGGKEATQLNMSRALAAQFPPFIAIQHAARFGIDPATYLKLSGKQGEVMEKEETYFKERLKKAGLHLDPEGGVSEWQEFLLSLGRAKKNFDIITMRLAKDLIDTGVMAKLDKAMESAADTFIELNDKSKGLLGVIVALLTGMAGIEAILLAVTKGKWVGPLFSLAKYGLPFAARGGVKAIPFIGPLLAAIDPDDVHADTPQSVEDKRQQVINQYGPLGPGGTGAPIKLPKPDNAARSFGTRFGVEFPGGGSKLNRFSAENPNYFNDKVPVGPQSSIIQNNNINIDGAGDPGAVANAVQSKVGALGRDLGVALRQAGMVPVVT